MDTTSQDFSTVSSVSDEASKSHADKIEKQVKLLDTAKQELNQPTRQGDLERFLKVLGLT